MHTKNAFLTLLSFTVFLLYFTFSGILMPFLASIPQENGGFKTLSSKNDLYKIVDNFYNPDDFYNFKNFSYNINIIADFYNALNSSDDFDVLTSFNQAIAVTDFKGDPSFYYNSEEFIENNPSSYINIKSIQLNYKAYGFYNIEIDDGNDILWSNISYRSNHIPVLLGSDYKKYYLCGDVISGNYYSKDVTFEVIGFLKENCSIKYKNISDLALDTYMLIPYPANLWEVTNDFQFESLLYFAMINCDLLPFVNEYQILKDIKKISNETNFSNFSLVGIDNFQIQHIELLLFVQKHKELFIISLLFIFVLSNIIGIKLFRHILKSFYKQSVEKEYDTNYFILNAAIPYGVAFLLGESISILFLKKVLPTYIFLEMLTLLLSYIISYIFYKKQLSQYTGF